MSIKANWPFYNATLAGSPGPTLDCVRATPGGVSDWREGHLRVAANKPRFAGLTGMTNILTNSDDLTHADWNKELLETPVQDGTLDPFGNPAWKLQATTGTGFHMLQQEAINPFAGPKTMERTFGCLIKAGTAQYAALGFYDHDAAGLAGGTTVVDLQNGIVTDSCSYYEDNGDGGNGRQDVFNRWGTAGIGLTSTYSPRLTTPEPELTPSVSISLMIRTRRTCRILEPVSLYMSASAGLARTNH